MRAQELQYRVIDLIEVEPRSEGTEEIGDPAITPRHAGTRPMMAEPRDPAKLHLRPIDGRGMNRARRDTAEQRPMRLDGGVPDLDPQTKARLDRVHRRGFVPYARSALVWRPTVLQPVQVQYRDRPCRTPFATWKLDGAAHGGDSCDLLRHLACGVIAETRAVRMACRVNTPAVDRDDALDIIEYRA